MTVPDKNCDIAIGHNDINPFFGKSQSSIFAKPSTRSRHQRDFCLIFPHFPILFQTTNHKFSN